MFQSGYQGGPYFEIFSTQGRDSTANWKLSSSGIKKIYEKDVKGYVLTLEGAPATTKLQAPKDSKQTLTLVQRFLVVQLYVPRGADFSMEIGVTDLANNKRRLVLSSAQKETQVTPLHAKIPLAVLRRAVWMNLVLDMVSLVGETWTSQTYRSIDQLSISANCKVRRIFTMKSQAPDTTDDDELYGCSATNNKELDNIPKQCQMAHDVHHITQVITLNKIKCAERLKAGKGPSLAEQIRPGSMLELDLSASGRKLPSSDGKIAFGSKAPKAPPETGRKTARQGSLTNRSIRSQTSRIDGQNLNNSNSISGSNQNLSTVSDSINNIHDSILQGGRDSLDVPSIPKPQAPSSAGSSHTSHTSSTFYSRQQSEPVTLEDYSSVSLNGIKDSPIVAPHPPRQPSNDRVRRRPRVKGIGQRGDPNYSSPPTSALVGHHQPHDASLSPGQGSGVRVLSAESHMKDSGVGPDVPEIQSPRKGQSENQDDGTAYNEYDSVSDVISLLRGQEESEIGKPVNNSWRRSEGNDHRIEEERQDEMNRENHVTKGGQEDGTGGSSSASENSNPGEYEESDEEPSTETNKLHFFISPPKSAPRRNISPAANETDTNQNKKSFVKAFRSNVKKTSELSSQRGARLEDDFVSHSSSEDESPADVIHHHHHHPHSRFRRPLGSAATTASLRNNHHHHNHQNPSAGSGTSSAYNSTNYTSSSSSHTKSSSATNGKTGSQSRLYTPKTSASPDQRPRFNPNLYSDSGRSSLSRMSRKSLREITNPHADNKLPGAEGNNKQYDHKKYQVDDLTESFERRMFESMRRQGEEVLEDISPPPGAKNFSMNASQTLRSSSHFLNPSDSKMVHLYSESPATTSDDDTSFSTWKAPAPNQVPHNYQDEMKSRRSSDTLASSNPRDWSGVLSPPIDPLSQVQDLQGTMEGISDELSDEAPTSNEMTRKYLTKKSEEKLDLYFDPKLNCYYDPQSKKWYELLT